MGKLNAPREVPYAFRVVEIDGWVWLYDNSERTYICSQVPNVYAEALYPTADGDEANADAYDSRPNDDYFTVAQVEALPSFPVPARDEDTAAGVDPRSAWDSARDEAQSNCLI